MNYQIEIKRIDEKSFNIKYIENNEIIKEEIIIKKYDKKSNSYYIELSENLLNRRFVQESMIIKNNDFLIIDKIKEKRNIIQSSSKNIFKEDENLSKEENDFLKKIFEKKSYIKEKENLIKKRDEINKRLIEIDNLLNQ